MPTSRDTYCKSNFFSAKPPPPSVKWPLVPAQRKPSPKLQVLTVPNLQITNPQPLPPTGGHPWSQKESHLGEAIVIIDLFYYFGCGKLKLLSLNRNEALVELPHKQK